MRISYLVAPCVSAAVLALASSAQAAHPGDLVVQQRSFRGIRAIEAWNYTTCTREMVVAIIDSGIDVDHPDLRNNIWKNEDEVAFDGVDDDGNGYVDDAIGWDFVGNDADPRDRLGRGTHLAGIVGAEGGNGMGVAGAWRGRARAPARRRRHARRDYGCRARRR